jgi:Spy/CpxP family protein refolding chaperone
MRQLRNFAPGVWVLGCLLILGPALARAQDNTPPPPRLPLDRAELNLSQQQKDQIKQIHEEQRAKMQALRNDSSLSREDRRAKMQELRNRTRSSVDAVLSPEQRQKLEQFRKEHPRRGRRGGFGPGRPPAGGPQQGPGGPDL